MQQVKNIETILKRIMSKPRFNGNMVQDTQSMYEETDPSCTFEWLDDRTKPTWAEITAEFYVYCSESDCPLCPDCCAWNAETKEFEYDFSIPKDQKKIELSEDCGDAIVLSPVTSDTLGSIHTYDCRKEDQENAGKAYDIALGKSISKNIVCNDGVSYEPRLHTAAQILDVRDAMNTHIETQRAKLVVKKGEVDAIDRANYDTDAECIAAIQAISW